ncbi:MAG TPA: hypothetical protein VGG88_06155, partial [Gaiellaceae bacterium]
MLDWRLPAAALLGSAMLVGALPDVASASLTPRLYWTEGTIARAGLDGTAVNHSLVLGASAPYGIAVDGQHIYWANESVGTIGRANLDGTNVDESFITGASNPIELAVDAQHIYWTNLANGTIGRANVDGT